jgi:hypothetical protein
MHNAEVLFVCPSTRFISKTQTILTFLAMVIITKIRVINIILVHKGQI